MSGGGSYGFMGCCRIFLVLNGFVRLLRIVGAGKGGVEGFEGAGSGLQDLKRFRIMRLQFRVLGFVVYGLVCLFTGLVVYLFELT